MAKVIMDVDILKEGEDSSCYDNCEIMIEKNGLLDYINIRILGKEFRVNVSNLTNAIEFASNN